MICKCGCGQEVKARPYWNKKGKHYPQYCWGHYGKISKFYSFKPDEAWNKGLTKEECPTLARMGYQKGHKPYNDWSKVNQLIKNDPEFKEKWRESKKGITPWNKGLHRCFYPNGIAKGENHGNWKGVGKSRDLAEYRTFRYFIFKRDKGTCQKCGCKGRKYKIDMHHIVPISKDKTKILDSFNVTLLCKTCHILIHSQLRKSSGN